MHSWVWYQIHSDLIQVHIQISFETHGTGQVVDHMGDNWVLFLVVSYFLALATDVKDWSTYLIARSVTTLHFFFLLVLLINSGNNIKKSLIINRQHAIRILNQHIKSKHGIIWWSDYIVIIRRKHACRESENCRVQISQVFYYVGAKTTASSSAKRMQEEKALETVAFLYCLAHFLLNLLFVHGSIHQMTTSPVVSCTWLVFDALPGFKNVFQFSIKNLIINNTTFHINHYSSSFQVSNLRTAWEIPRRVLISSVNIPKEWADRLIIYQTFIVLSMLSKSKLPKFKANLIIL